MVEAVAQTIRIPRINRLLVLVIHSGFVVSEFYKSWISSVLDLGKL